MSFSNEKHQLEERISRKDGAVQSFKRHKSSSNDAGNPEGASTESQSVMMAASVDGAQQTESMTLAATIQNTQQALLQCGQDASLAPFVAMIQHVGQQMIKSQHELENDRRKWENRRREMEGRHILHPTQGSMEALVNQACPAGGMKTWQQEHDDSKRLQEMRNDCWAAVTRLLVEVVLIHRLANHLGLLILRSWKRIEQQGALYDDDPLSRFGLWISALTELVRKSIKLVCMGSLLLLSVFKLRSSHLTSNTGMPPMFQYNVRYCDEHYGFGRTVNAGRYIPRHRPVLHDTSLASGNVLWCMGTVHLIKPLLWNLLATLGWASFCDKLVSFDASSVFRSSIRS